MTRAIGLSFLAILVSAAAGRAAAPAAEHPRTWPQAYTVQQDQAAGVLTLSTPFYVIQHDLQRGGALTRITLTHGKAKNLLVQPLEIRIRDEQDRVLTDLKDSAAQVAQRREGLKEIVTVESSLCDSGGEASPLRVRSTYEYRWGHVKIRREILAPAGTGVREVSPAAMILSPSLSQYGYRDGRAEEDGAPPFSFGSNVWGKLRVDRPADAGFQTPHVPRSVLLADPGVEGLEWFASSDLWQWDRQLTGRRGEARCLLQRTEDPAGVSLRISPLWSGEQAVALPASSTFDFYLGFPLLDGRAHRPWLHTSFNRNRGDWVASDEIRRWAEKGIQTVHCHNDGDYYGDGLFWRDGAYPPYPDMDRYDRVLKDCREAGIRTATYFSNKELHSSTDEFQKQGQTWGRMNRAGGLQRNFFRAGSEFGVQMCLRSGWLECLKSSIDRVLANHPLDGVYYDWNVALYCCNPAHEPQREGQPASGHWDIDELLELMEWTRSRVGPEGLVIIHNTTTPMFATENFADYVVATEWGYGKWTERAPDLESLPLEWSLVGAVPRGVISYGVLDRNSPRQLHRLFALGALLGGVTPWPASPEAFALRPLLEPLGEVPSYRFADWRNPAVTLSHPRCAAAVYSRPGEAYLLLANLDPEPHEVTCVLHPDRLPHPLRRPVSAKRVAASYADAAAEAAELDLQQLTGAGMKLALPGAEAVLIQVR